MKITVDGNTACAKMAYAFSEMAVIYPITPSSPMAESCDEWQTKGEKNLFGDTVKVSQMQSEAGVAGAVHGALACGALATTFTASQGLLLMIPNMYKIAGELLPTVFHVTARALSTHALSIFGDHADVMACRQTGFAMICSNTVQEAQDMAVVSHIATLKSRVPFLHFFDGFRTSHEIQKIDGISYDDLKKILPQKEIESFKLGAMSSVSPHQQGTAQNPDIYFQNREACEIFYKQAPEAVLSAMKDVEKITGRHYSLFEYFGDPNATDVVVLMGSGVETMKETQKYLAQNGQSGLGVLCVRLYRPFASAKFVEALPKTTKRIAVLDRTKENGSDGEPLYKDVASALYEYGCKAKVVHGRYGLGGKDFTPAMAKSVFDNLQGDMKNDFTVGIVDDVLNSSLPYDKSFHIGDDNYSCKFFGLGSDGTVSANKNSIKIIGSNTDLFAQGYFEYDSKKSGSATISHLRFGKNHTNQPYLVTNANFVACHNISFVGKYDMASDLKQNGIFLLNSPYGTENLNEILPQKFFETLKAKNAKLYVINANEVSEKAGLGKRINVVMQACFFKLTNIIPYDTVENLLIDASAKTYAKKGQAIVDANIRAIKNATANLKEYDLSKYVAHKEEKPQEENLDAYDKDFIKIIEHKHGDDLPVSKFSPRGYVPTNTSRLEKRGISITSPRWIKQNCIQCNMCSAVCPHSAIRPVLVPDDKLSSAPESFETTKALGVNDCNFRVQIDVANCTGCENCVKVCPAKNKALEMVSSVDLEKAERENVKYASKIENPKTIFKTNTLKGSQFEKPYFEFSGACAGCGETPYIKLASQLFGKRMIIANATGCSSIYSGSAPTSPFAKNSLGHGPAWASSLFEDNAEFGYGMALAKKNARIALKNNVIKYLPNCKNEKLASLLSAWLENIDDGEKSYDLSNEILSSGLLKGTPLEKHKNSFVKESVWIVGGDGWAYDIGFGGLDQVLASGENVNILVLDTEVYSNTGGQMSKATPLSATAKFASSGKRTPKKDLGMIAMTYKNVYVAQIGLGANMNQAVQAMAEAESYNGPSLIIAYAPCINHGINMSGAQDEIKKAVASGYWNLFRYDPRLLHDGKNPFRLDSPAPSMNYEDFLKGEARYTALERLSPQLAEKLFEESKKCAMERYEMYKQLASQTE